MASEYWTNFISEIRDCTGIEFGPGLTDAEVAAAELTYSFRFPPDLRQFLQTGLPCGRSFPDWRDGDEASLREWLDIPRRGILFDVTRNGFWLEEWGTRPTTEAEAEQRVAELVSAAPKLVPIFAHRMIPCEPHQAGNPVFSVHQTDIIHFGVDLRDYLIHEFFTKPDIGVWPLPDTIRPIRFWDVNRFQSVRWGTDGVAFFDNSSGVLP